MLKKNLIDGYEVYLKSTASVFIEKLIFIDHKRENNCYTSDKRIDVKQDNSIIMKVTNFLTLGVWS